MTLLPVLQELKVQLLEAETTLINTSPADIDNYDLWMEQQKMVIEDLKHDIEYFA